MLLLILVHIFNINTALDASLVTTNPTRSNNYYTYCAGLSSTLVTSSDRTLNSGYFQTLAKSLSFSQDQLTQALVNLNFTYISSYAQSLPSEYFNYLIPYVIGMGASLLAAIILLPFCICPREVPLRRCRSKLYGQYTKCQLMWPTVLAFMCLFAAIIVAVIGTVNVSGLSTASQQLECGISIFFDNIVNGNISSDQSSFFSGTQQLNSMSNSLPSTISNMVSQFTTVLSGQYTAINSMYNSVINDTYYVANSTANASLQLSYATAFGNAPFSTSANTNSTFPTVLGTVTTSNSILSNITNIVNTIVIPLTNIISTDVTSLPGYNTTFWTLYNGLANATSLYNSLVSYADSNMVSYYSPVNTYASLYKNGMASYFVIMIVFSVLALVGLILIRSYEKYRCRYLVYLSCSVIFILTVAGFLFTTAFAFMVPMLYYSCNSINSNINSEVNLANYTTYLGLASNYSAVLANCVAGDASFMENDTNVNLMNMNLQTNTSLTSLQTMQTSLSSMDISTLVPNITVYQTLISNYLDSTILDLAVGNTGNTWFLQLANRTLFSSSCNSSSSNWIQDQLVPNINNAQFNCSTVGNQSCTSTITSCTSTGCIDLYQMMLAETSSTNFGSDVLTRYGGCDSNLATQFADLYDNWHTPRVAAISGVLNRFNSGVMADSTTLATYITNVTNSTNLANLANLISQLNTVSDSSYGLQAGMNCTVVGESFQQIVDVVCVNVFNKVYYMMTILTICSSFAGAGFIILMMATLRLYQKYLKDLEDVFYRQPQEAEMVEKNMIPEKTFTSQL